MLNNKQQANTWTNVDQDKSVNKASSCCTVTWPLRRHSSNRHRKWKVFGMFLHGNQWPVTSFTHYSDIILGVMASQITSLTIVYSAVHSGADQRKHQSSASLAFVRGIHRWPVNSLHKGPVTRKMFPFDDIMLQRLAKPVCHLWHG